MIKENVKEDVKEDVTTRSFLTGSAAVLSAILITLVLLNTGCSAVKDMQDKTSQMAGDTNTLANKTGHMADDTDSLLSQTIRVQNGVSSTYSQMREGNSATARTGIGYFQQMNASKKIEEKIKFAGLYFASYEFQLWTGLDNDTQDRLEDLYDAAMQEFGLDLASLTKGQKVNATSQTNNTLMDLQALSIAMHKLNPYSVDQSMESDDKPQPVSMFDLIKRVMRKGPIEDSGRVASADLPDWIREGRTHEQDFAFLIKMRENFLAVATLAGISNLSERGFLGIPGLFNKADKLFFKWDADVAKLNPEQLTTYASYLEESVNNRAFLEELDLPAELDANVAKIYRNMRLPVETDPARATHSDALRQFQSAVKDLLMQ